MPWRLAKAEGCFSSGDWFLICSMVLCQGWCVRWFFVRCFFLFCIVLFCFSGGFLSFLCPFEMALSKAHLPHIRVIYAVLFSPDFFIYGKSKLEDETPWEFERSNEFAKVCGSKVVKVVY